MVSTIALAHGYLGFVRLGAVEYFNGVAEHLRMKCGVRVITPEVDPVGTIEKRSSELERQIQSSFIGERVHMIAHSAGGLDSRHLLSPQGRNRSDLVATLTTISTP